jgi:hypothetical protein
MNDASAVRVIDGLTRLKKSPQELSQFPTTLSGSPVTSLMKVIDGLLEAFATDEPHRVVGSAVRRASQTIDGHDAGVLEASGNLRLSNEPVSTGGIVGVAALNLFESDFSAKFEIPRHKDLA